MQRVTGEPLASEHAQTLAKKATSRELLVRIYSSLILIAVALFLTIASLETFALLITLFIGAMAWEWGRLVRGATFDAAFFVQLGATAIASWATVYGCLGCALAAVATGTIAVFAVRALQDERPRAWWSAAGVYYAGLPAIALIWLRSDAGYGWLAILYIFAIVWSTDSAAYLFGRMLGGPKLAPRISPKKTWSGLIGGALSAGLAALIFSGFVTGTSGLHLALLAIALAVVSQLGDLGESALKRIFGMKDSSGLIPGHGGVLDRIDGLVVVAVAAGLIAWSLDPASPARALLLWP